MRCILLIIVLFHCGSSLRANGWLRPVRVLTCQRLQNKLPSPVVSDMMSDVEGLEQTSFKPQLHSTADIIASAMNLVVVDRVDHSGSVELTMSRKVDNVNDSSESYCPTVEELDTFHAKLYSALEADPVVNGTLASIAITVSSPGIGEELRTDRDFITFKVRPISDLTLMACSDRHFYGLL